MCDGTTAVCLPGISAAPAHRSHNRSQEPSRSEHACDALHPLGCCEAHFKTIALGTSFRRNAPRTQGFVHSKADQPQMPIFRMLLLQTIPATALASPPSGRASHRRTRLRKPDRATLSEADGPSSQTPDIRAALSSVPSRPAPRLTRDGNAWRPILMCELVYKAGDKFSENGLKLLRCIEIAFHPKAIARR